MNPRPAEHFTLVSRAECHLCEEMLAELEAFLAGRAVRQVSIVDVDSDPELRRRFGLKVPVLLIDGELACHGRFDAAEVSRLLRR